MLKATAGELRGTGPFERCALLGLVSGALAFMAKNLNCLFHLSDCALRMAPDVADAVSNSDELASYRDVSPWVRRMFEDPSLHDPGCHTLEYALPPFLYGLRLGVDPSLPPGTARVNSPIYEMVEQPAAPGLRPEPVCVAVEDLEPVCVAVEDLLEITDWVTAAIPDYVVGR